MRSLVAEMILQDSDRVVSEGRLLEISAVMDHVVVESLGIHSVKKILKETVKEVCDQHLLETNRHKEIGLEMLVGQNALEDCVELLSEILQKIRMAM